MSAARRAASGAMPSLIFSAVRRSMYARSSSFRSRSCRSRSNMRASSCVAERQTDGDGDARPLVGLLPELPSAGACELVVFRAAFRVRLAPVRLQPSGLLHTMERREETAGLHPEGALRDLLDPPRDAH